MVGQLKEIQLQAELPFDSCFRMSWILSQFGRWADHSLVTEGGQLVPGRPLRDTAGSVNAGEDGHIWASLAILRGFTVEVHCGWGQDWRWEADLVYAPFSLLMDLPHGM